MQLLKQPRFTFPNLAITLSLLATVGCGGKPATVSGIVTVDSKPLEQGTVFFAPVDGGMRASGIIQDDGSYEIRTNRAAGLDLGDYHVAVVSRELVFPHGPDGPPMPGKYLAPKKYGKPTTSELKYSVVAGSNEINLDLTSDE